MKTRINPIELKYPQKAYSHAILLENCKNILYITGQLSQNKFGEMMFADDVESQTRKVFENISYILKAANMNIEDVVKLNIYFRNREDIKLISDIRDEIFREIRPASTMVQVLGFARDEALVEIDVIASSGIN